VICVRNPLDAAASTRRMAGARHAMDNRQAIDVWERYTASAIVNTSGRPRLFVSYESYFADCRAMSWNLARFAGLHPPGQGDDPTFDTLADQRLRHHSNPIDNALRGDVLPPSTNALYTALQAPMRQAVASIAGGSGQAEEELDGLARRLLDAEPDKVVGPFSPKR